VQSIVAIGGGSAIGIGEAVAVRMHPYLVVIPTMYSGWGLVEQRPGRTQVGAKLARRALGKRGGPDLPITGIRFAVAGADGEPPLRVPEWRYPPYIDVYPR
jgi:hypothetical protein